MRMTIKVLAVAILGAGIVSAALILVLVHEDSFSCPPNAKYCKVLIEKNGKLSKWFYITRGNYSMKVYAVYAATSTTTTTTSSTTTTIHGGGVGVGCAREVPCDPPVEGVTCIVDVPCQG